MQTGPDRLLEKVWAKGLSLGISGTQIVAPSRSLGYSGETLAVAVPFRGASHGSILVTGWGGDVLVLELADNVAIVFSSQATEKLQRHDQENDSDARPGKHPSRSDMPGGRNETFATSSVELPSIIALEQAESRRNHSAWRELTCVDCVPVPKHLKKLVISNS